MTAGETSPNLLWFSTAKESFACAGWGKRSDMPFVFIRRSGLSVPYFPLEDKVRCWARVVSESNPARIPTVRYPLLEDKVCCWAPVVLELSAIFPAGRQRTMLSSGRVGIEPWIRIVRNTGRWLSEWEVLGHFASLALLLFLLLLSWDDPMLHFVLRKATYWTNDKTYRLLPRHKASNAITQSAIMI